MEKWRYISTHAYTWHWMEIMVGVGAGLDSSEVTPVPAGNQNCNSSVVKPLI
jgi:hypothetical protein